MKNLLFVLFAGLFALVSACGPAASSQGTEETAEMNADSTAAAASTITGENYTIQVVDSTKTSPRKEMAGTVAGVKVTVNYGSPSVKGRTIWGATEDILVAYGEIWRTGANEATTIEFSNDVVVEGQALAAGKYALFTIPNENAWTIVFNQAANQWGAMEYDEAKDVLRVQATPVAKEEARESLDFIVEGNSVVLRWEKLAIPFQVAAAE